MRIADTPGMVFAIQTGAARLVGTDLKVKLRHLMTAKKFSLSNEKLLSKNSRVRFLEVWIWEIPMEKWTESDKY